MDLRIGVFGDSMADGLYAGLYRDLQDQPNVSVTKFSQVSTGRKNALRFEVDGSAGALAWDAERHEELWLGRRDGPNETLLRNAALMHPTAAARTHLPPAHAEGFADTFRELYRAVYADVARGGPSDEPDYPTFRDGHVENVLCDAVALSNRERRWVEVPS